MIARLALVELILELTRKKKKKKNGGNDEQQQQLPMLPQMQTAEMTTVQSRRSRMRTRRKSQTNTRNVWSAFFKPRIA